MLTAISFVSAFITCVQVSRQALHKRLYEQQTKQGPLDEIAEQHLSSLTTGLNLSDRFQLGKSQYMSV